MTATRVLLLALLALTMPRGAAWAHAMLLESRPADGAVVDDAPAEIVLRFNEPVTPIRAQVLDRAGRPLGLPAPPLSVDKEIRIALPAGLPAGDYLVSFRIMSADSHPVGGAFVFAIGPESGARPASASSHDTMETGGNAGSVANRALHYLSLLVAVGGVLFLTLVARGGPGEMGYVGNAVRRGIRVAAAVAAITALLGVGLQGVLLLGATAGGLTDPAAWRIGAESTTGRSAVIAIAGLALLTFGVRRAADSGGAVLAMAGAAVALFSLAATGHAATAPPRWLTAPAVFLHGFAAAFWIGSLAPLVKALRGPDAAQAAAHVQRFSRLAVPAVALLVAAGLIIAIAQVRDATALLTTGYGRLLLLKLAFVALLLLVAAHNKIRLTPALKAGGATARRDLVRTIRVEIALAIIILSATAGLGAVAPPRAQHVHDAPTPIHATAVTAGGYAASIEIAPTAGRYALTVRFATVDGGAFDPQEATIRLELPAAGIEPITRPLRRIAPGIYRHDGSGMPFPGQWRITIEALIDDFEKATFTAELPAR